MAAEMAAARAAMEPNVPCPRCGSADTKFSYFNNGSVSQPRYLCKGCGRYWTRGGALRDVPVGAGYKKGSKRRRQAAASSSQPPPPPLFSPQAFPSLHFGQSFVEMVYEVERGRF